MAFHTIQHQVHQNPNPKFEERLTKFKSLLQELEGRDLPEPIVNFINTEIAQLNSQNSGDPKLHKQVSQLQNRILKRLEKDLKLVPKNYYRQLWMVLGMSAFGIPMGVAFGLSLGNMAFLGIGLPLGMVLGLATGSNMDKKAEKEGRQLNFTSNT